MNPPKQTNIVSLAFGSVALYNQTIFSLLTLYYQLNGDFKNLQVVIYTDDAAIFNKYLGALPLIIELLSKEQIKKFKGPTGNNFYRIKTCILKDCLERHPGDVFYIDCDTFFLKNPRPLFEKITQDVSILNAFESDLYDAGGWETQTWFQLRSVVRDHTFTIKGATVKIPLTTKMWNAGIIGISSSSIHLADEILDLTDQVFDISPIYLTEQFTVSYVVQAHTDVISTADYLEHYWSKAPKAKFNFHFKAFFALNQGLPLQELVIKAHELFLDREKLFVPKIKKEPVFKRLKQRLLLTLQVACKGHL